jgi:hypothetical protein
MLVPLQMRRDGLGSCGRWAARRRRAALRAGARLVLVGHVGRALAADPATAPPPATDAAPPGAPAPTRPAAPGLAPDPGAAPPAASPPPLAPPPASAEPRPAPALAENDSVERAQALLAQRIGRLAPEGVAPCSLRATLELARRTFVACGPGGVWLVELGAEGQDRLLQRWPLAGSAVGLFSRNGHVWVEIETRSAQPIEQAGDALLAPPSAQLPLAEAPPCWPPPPAPPLNLPVAPPPGPLAAAPAPPVVPGQMHVAILGRVIASEAGRLVVDLGSHHGVDVGAHIELVVERDSSIGRFRDRRVLAVGRVASIADEQSLVELGLAEDVPLGAQAALTEHPLTSSRLAPPRVAGIWTLAAILRPFFVLEQLGFGALNELSIGYRSEGPLRYQLLSSPIGFSAAEDGAIFSAVVLALVSYDTRSFEIGVGFGGQTINDSDYAPGSGVTVAQTLRFGSLDGLNLSIRNDVSLFHAEFEYSAFNGQAQVPVSDHGWLVLQGGGGSVGYGFFEAGGKVLVHGNGTGDSLFLRGTVGYAALYERRDRFALTGEGFSAEPSLDHDGPLVGFGVEWRK